MMKLAQITTADVKRITKLLEQKEALQDRVAKIDGELTALDLDRAAAPAKAISGQKTGARGRARFGKGKRAPKGAAKAAIVELLKGAGSHGLKVKEIASKLGFSYSAVFTWFSTTGRKMKEIKKIGRGKYAWVG